ncbi:ABC transporter substrate-binding protein [Candidatus Falkowbacteria bacterium]|nr:ABC transporter substrate-binding protein [Candidatus Falkowbacteria bacterium]
MSFFKTKIIPFWRRAKNACSSFILVKRFFKKENSLNDQIELDKKLVYSLSPRKIPDGKQLKHLRKFLKPREVLFIRICLLIFVLCLSFLAYSFFIKKIIFLPKSGGTYTEALVGYPKNINPLYSAGREVDNDISSLVYSSLFRYNKDGVLEDDLVEFFEIKEDGKEYLIKIKDNVKWHDGSDLSADDVVFTFNLIQDESYRAPLRQAFIGVSVEKVDELFVKFILPEAHAPFTSLLTFGILPKSLWENSNPDSIILSELNLKPVGSGPFKFESISKTKSGEVREYSLEANQDYYGGQPYLKAVKFIFYPDRQEAIKALNDKQILGLNNLPFSQRNSLLAKNSLYIRDLAQPQVISLFFNESKNESLKDKNLRLALAQGINKDELVSEIFSNAYRRVDSPFLEESLAYNSELEAISYLPDLAREFLKEKSLKLELTTVDTGSNLVVAEKVKSYWQELGVEIEIKAVSGEQIIEIIKKRDFQVLLYGQVIGGDPDIYAFWHSSQIDSGLNLAGYNNETVDRLLVEARTINNLEERMGKYKEIQKELLNDVPVIFLYSPAYTYVQAKDLRGFSGQVLIEAGNRFNDIENWYLKTKKKIAW